MSLCLGNENEFVYLYCIHLKGFLKASLLNYLTYVLSFPFSRGADIETKSIRVR